MPRLIPSEVVADLSVDAIVDFTRCPHRFYRSHVESDPERRYGRGELLELVGWRLVRELVRAREATSARARRGDLEALVSEAAAELGAGADVLELAAAAVWRWWTGLEEDEAAIVAVDVPFGLALDAGEDPWTLSGRTPLVLRRPGERPRAAILRLRERPLAAAAAADDLEVALVGLAATEVLRLEGGSVEFHHVRAATAEDGEPELELEVREVPEERARWDRALSVAGGVRQAIRDALTGETFAFWPARWAPDCARELCSHVPTCESTFGGPVRSSL